MRWRLAIALALLVAVAAAVFVVRRNDSHARVARSFIDELAPPAAIAAAGARLDDCHEGSAGLRCVLEYGAPGLRGELSAWGHPLQLEFDLQHVLPEAVADVAPPSAEELEGLARPIARHAGGEDLETKVVEADAELTAEGCGRSISRRVGNDRAEVDVGCSPGHRRVVITPLTPR